MLARFLLTFSIAMVMQSGGIHYWNWQWWAVIGLVVVYGIVTGGEQ